MTTLIEANSSTVERGLETGTAIEILRDPIELTPWHRGRIVAAGIRDIRSLTVGFSEVTLDIPGSLDKWLIEPNVASGHGIRLRRFNRCDGTLEMITATRSFRTRSEGVRTSTPSQLLWQDFTGNNPPELNTDIAAERLGSAISDILSLLPKQSDR